MIIMADWSLSAQIKILPDAIHMKLPVHEADYSVFSQLTVEFGAEHGFASALEVMFLRSQCNGKVHAFLTVTEAHHAKIMTASSVILFISFPGLLLLLPQRLLISLTMDDQDISFNRMRAIECDELDSQS